VNKTGLAEALARATADLERLFSKGKYVPPATEGRLFVFCELWV
jgi:hypothetical protein